MIPCPISSLLQYCLPVACRTPVKGVTEYTAQACPAALFCVHLLASADVDSVSACLLRQPVHLHASQHGATLCD